MGKVALNFVPSSLSEAFQSFSSAIITGGSSGLGQSFIGMSRKMHPELSICNLSRRAPGNFSGGKGLHHITCDLARSSEVEQVASQVLEWLRRAPEGRVLLINNSGFGTYGPFPEANLERTLEMVDVNARAAVHLTGRLLPALRQRGGAVVNIASTAAYVPVVYTAVYGATKAFLLHWSLALSEELRGSSVQVLAVSPGTTKTAFFRHAGVSDSALQGRMMQTADEVIGETMRALAAGRNEVVTGWRNRLMIGLLARLSKPRATRVAARVLRRYWERQER